MFQGDIRNVVNQDILNNVLFNCENVFCLLLYTGVFNCFSNGYSYVSRPGVYNRGLLGVHFSIEGLPIINCSQLFLS